MSLRPCAVLLLSVLFNAPVVGQCGFHETEKIRFEDLDNLERFGSIFDLSGDVIVAGLPFDNTHGSWAGAAVVYRKVHGWWHLEQTLFASDAAAFDAFGVSVAVSGDVIVVGAWQVWTNENIGKAHVFRHDGSAWVEEAILRGSGGPELFGEVVEVDGNVIAVGVPSRDASVVNVGGVYVFRHQGGSWLRETLLELPGALIHDGFGWAVRVHGSLLVAGAPWRDLNGMRNTGTALIYRHDGTDWQLEETLLASDGAQDDNFGSAVGVWDDRVAIGAPGHEPCGQRDCPQGAVYVYHNNSGTWSPETKLISRYHALFGTRFGATIGLQGEAIVVGEIRIGDGPDELEGAATLFARGANGWQVDAVLRPSDLDERSEFGWTVGFDGETVAVGARFDAAGCDPPCGTGSIYTYENPPSPAWKNYGEGVPGTLGVPDLVLDTAPVVGGSAVLHGGSSTGSANIGVLFVGPREAMIPTTWGGNLLVEIATGPALLVLGPAGTDIELRVPDDDLYCGINLYWQLLQPDAGAPRGVSISRGLRMRIGR